MSGHTPGPWECGSINYPESGMGKCEITQVGEMGILAHVYVPHPPYEGSKEGPANARLIVAAPEMYEALKINLEAHSLIEIDRAMKAMAAALGKAEYKS